MQLRSSLLVAQLPLQQVAHQAITLSINSPAIVSSNITSEHYSYIIMSSLIAHSKQIKVPFSRAIKKCVTRAWEQQE